MAKTNTEILGTAGQVAEEEHVIRISPKSLRNYLIIAGTIMILISAIAVFALVGGKSKDVVDSAGVPQKEAKASKAKNIKPGPFSEKEAINMAALNYREIMEQRVFEGNGILKRTQIDEDFSSIKCVKKEKGRDEIGVERDIYVMDIHLVGSYDSVINNRRMSFDMSFVLNAVKIEHGLGFKVLTRELTQFQVS